MAVFLVNVCKFNSCGLKFASLSDLIRHIEEIHLDCEQKLIETIENPTCLPVSCVLRVFSHRPDDLNSISSSIDSNTLNESHTRKSINSPAASLSTTPTEGSEFDEEDADSDSGQSSIDSWATANADSTTNPLLKFHQIMGQTTNETTSNTKLTNSNPNKEQRLYICGFTGCTKQYRSSNSLSHHRRSAHKVGNIKPQVKPTDDSNKKLYKCFCGKIYKTSHGLKSHCNLHHNQTPQTSNSDSSCNSNMAITALNATPELNQENSAQLSNSFVQPIKTSPNSLAKTEISSTVKENLLYTINRMKNANLAASLANGKLEKIKANLFNEITDTQIIPDNNCPPVSINVEVTSEPKSGTKCPPIILAPTLQQHLLSPIIPKVASN